MCCFFKVSNLELPRIHAHDHVQENLSKNFFPANCRKRLSLEFEATVKKTFAWFKLLYTGFFNMFKVK